MMGPIIPGIVAKVFVMPRRIPAYLQKHFYRGLLMCYTFLRGRVGIEHVCTPCNGSAES